MRNLLSEISQWAVVALAVTLMGQLVWRKRGELDFVIKVWQHFTLKMFAECVCAIAGVVAVMYVLYHVPGFKYGWMHLFFERGGNYITSAVASRSKSEYEIVRLLPVLYFAAFALMIPFLAQFEENMFRKGTKGWVSATVRSVLFGLFHLIAGIPLATAFALTVGGFYFTLAYWRGEAAALSVKATAEEAQIFGVFYSTVAHSLYNTIITVILICGSIYYL